MGCDAHVISTLVEGVICLALIGLVAFGVWIIGREP